MIRKTCLKTILLLLIPLVTTAQGLINNGALIIIESGASVIINGSGKGNYIDTTSGTSKGSIDNNGKFYVDGNWINNSATGTVFANADTTGTVYMEGDSVQIIGGSNSTNFENLQFTGNGYKTLEADNCSVKGVLAVNALLKLNNKKLIIENPSPDALTGTSHIISEGLPSAGYGALQWNIGADTGTYIIPFADTSGASHILKYMVKESGSDTGQVVFATYPTAADNTPYPTGITNVNGIDGNNNSTGIMDRYWIINLMKYNAKPKADVEFKYSDNDFNISPNRINEAEIAGLLYDTSANSWYHQNVGGTTDTANNTIRINGLQNELGFSAWSLGKYCYTTAEAGRDTIITAGDSVRIGSNPVSGYSYSWSPTTGLSNATVANPWAKPDTTIKYILSVHNDYYCSKNDTISVFVTPVIDFTISQDTIDIDDTAIFTNKSKGFISSTQFKLLIQDCINDSSYILKCLDSLIIFNEQELSYKFNVEGDHYIKLYAFDKSNNKIDSITKIIYVKLLEIDCQPICLSECNLVYNGSFECYWGLPCVDEAGSLSDIVFACPWKPIGMTPDWYFPGQTCGNNFWNVPNNKIGYELPHNSLGQGYAGLFTMASNSINPPTREYIWQEFSQSLDIGTTYQVDLWVSLAEGSCMATDIGILITDHLYYGPGHPWSYTRADLITNNNQPLSGTFLINSSGIVTNTNGWTHISGTIIPSISGLKYICIGKFNDPNTTNYGTRTPDPNYHENGTCYAYYYIDDVSIKPVPQLNPPSITAAPNILCAGLTSTLTTTGTSSNPPLTYLWSTGDTTSSVSVTPISTTTYTVTVIDKVGCTASNSIQVIVNTSPIAEAGNNQTICSGKTATLTASGGGHMRQLKLYSSVFQLFSFWFF